MGEFSGFQVKEDETFEQVGVRRIPYAARSAPSCSNSTICCPISQQVRICMESTARSACPRADSISPRNWLMSVGRVSWFAGSGESEARGRGVRVLCLEDINPFSGFWEPGEARPSRGGQAVVVLHKVQVQASRFFESFLVEAFKEETAGVAEYFGFDDEDVWDGG
jgi:hypothetical protein